MLSLFVSTACVSGGYHSLITATGTFEQDEQGLYFQPVLADGKIYLESTESLKKLCVEKQVIKMSACLNVTAQGSFYTESYCFIEVK